MDFQKLLQEARETNAVSKAGQLLPVKEVGPMQLFNMVQTRPDIPLWDTRSAEDFRQNHLRGARNVTTVECAEKHLAEVAIKTFEKKTIVLIGETPEEVMTFVRKQYDVVKTIYQISSEEVERSYPYLFLSQEHDEQGFSNQATRRAYCSYPALFSDTLLCGSIVHGSQFEQLRLLGVSACMDLTPNGVPNLGNVEGVTVIRPGKDAGLFECAAMLNSEVKTLVFDVGSEKAPSVICAYFMQKHADWKPATAIAFVMNKVPNFKPSPASHEEIQRGPPQRLLAPGCAGSDTVSPTDIRQIILDTADKWRIVPLDNEEGRLASRALSGSAEAIVSCRDGVIRGVKQNRVSGNYTSIRSLLGALLLHDDSVPSEEYRDAVAEMWEQVKDGETTELADILRGSYPMSTDGLPVHLSDLLRPLVLRLGIIDV